MTEYGHMLILNEILFGQERPHVGKYLTSHFRADLNQFYLCLTGLKKEVSTGYYHLSAPAFMDLFIRCGQGVRTYLESHGYTCEMQVVVYDQSKRTAIFLSPGTGADVSPLQAAEEIGAIFQRSYEARGCAHDGAYTTFTVLSPPLSGYGEIAPAFHRVRELSELAFFRMEPMVMTEEALAYLRLPLTREALFETLDTLTRAMEHGDVAETQRLCQGLFLEQLKASFSYPLLEDALHELKRQACRFADIYGLSFESPPEEVLRLNQPSIERLFARVERLLSICAAAVARRGTNMSYISLEAMRYLKKNFQKDLSLEDVATYINVNPSYLSRVFNREVGQNLRAYLTGLRISRAKELLGNLRLRVSDVAGQVGIQNAKYFTLSFKRETGMTPQQYRAAL